MNKKSQTHLGKLKAKRKQVSKENPRPVQLASPSQILHHEIDDVTAIVEFLENFRQMADPRAQHKSKLISIKVPVPLLTAFKFKAQQEKIPYQTMIKQLMLTWLKSHS